MPANYPIAHGLFNLTTGPAAVGPIVANARQAPPATDPRLGAASTRTGQSWLDVVNYRATVEGTQVHLPRWCGTFRTSPKD